MRKQHIFGRSIPANEIKQGEWAKVIDSDRDGEIIFGLSNESSEDLDVVSFEREQTEKGSFQIAIARDAISVFSGRPVWVLPAGTEIEVDFSRIRIPEHLQEVRQSTLILDKVGHLHCRVINGGWLNFHTAVLGKDLPGNWRDLLEFPAWSIVSGEKPHRRTHFNVTVDNVRLPLWLRRS